MTNNIDPVEIEKIEIENTDAVKAQNTQKVKKLKNPVIQNDIMRYKKNKFAANLALLGIVFGCIYFLSLYSQVDNGNFYYTWAIAFDVIYNLFFLLFVFLFSEQVKNYKKKMFPLQVLVGVLQIARIFWLPLSGIMADKIDTGSFILMTVTLAASGACIIASAIIGFIRSKAVEDFEKKVQAGEIDLEGELKKEENAGGEVNA